MSAHGSVGPLVSVNLLLYRIIHPVLEKTKGLQPEHVCVTNLLNEQLFSEENNLQLRFKVLPTGSPSLEDQ